MSTIIDTAAIDRDAQDRWKADPATRTEFGQNFEWYRSYARAAAAGRVRVLGGGGVVSATAPAPAAAPAAAAVPARSAGAGPDVTQMSMLRGLYPAHCAQLKAEGAAEEAARIDATLAAAFGGADKSAALRRAIVYGSVDDIRAAMTATRRAG